MANKDLVKYVMNQRSNGVGETDIREKLTDHGWSEADVEDAFHEIYSKVPKILTEKKSIKLLLLFRNPAHLFRQVKEEKFSQTLLYYLYFLIIYLAITGIIMAITIYRTGQILFAPSLLMALLFSFLLLPILGALFGIISLFISAFITNLGVTLFGGIKGYESTFKAVSYAAIASSIPYGIFSFLELVLSLYQFGFFFTIVKSFVSMVVYITIAIIGVSKLHEITLVRAALGVLIIPVILTGLSVLFVVLGAMLLFSNV